VSYLGARIAPTAVWPQKIQLRVDSLHTLNDFQKLLGDINWIRPYLKISNVKLKPQQLKTDNGPAYNAKTLVSFCQQMEVQVKNGLPYNPQGQGIIERAHRTLKELLIKQKGE
jgi:transposase InsO family protein